MAELTNYQQKVVKRYYEHLDTALLQRLGERVTDLYLAEGKKREKLWAGVAPALEKLGVPASRITRLTASDDPQQLATMVQELLSKA